MKGKLANWRMEWVANTLHTTSEQVYPALLPLMRTPRLPVVDLTDASADLNGLVRFAERRNLVSARVPSHFIWPLLTPWFRVHLEKLTDLGLVKKFPAFYGTPRFITTFTSVRHLSLS